MSPPLWEVVLNTKLKKCFRTELLYKPPWGFTLINVCMLKMVFLVYLVLPENHFYPFKICIHIITHKYLSFLH